MQAKTKIKIGVELKIFSHKTRQSYGFPPNNKSSHTKLQLGSQKIQHTKK